MQCDQDHIAILQREFAAGLVIGDTGRLSQKQVQAVCTLLATQINV